jgi:DNA invertase Pin-like site-specific DNA recombinase
LRPERHNVRRRRLHHPE